MTTMKKTAGEFIEEYLKGEKTTEGITFQFRNDAAKNRWDELTAKHTTADDKEIITYVQDWAKIMTVGMEQFGFTVAEMSDIIATKWLMEKRQFDTAVDLLYQNWIHGDEVAKWYDTTYEGK